MAGPSGLRRIVTGMFGCLGLISMPAAAASLCADERATEKLPTNLALCDELAPIVRKPHDLPIGQYETKLNEYVTAMCRRNFARGWQMDKTVRDTGPFIATLANGQWTGTHAPLLIWYSPEMMRRLPVN
jgi:hypothetical protein